MNFTRILGCVLLAATLSLSVAEAKNCVKGKPCGNACISKDDVCHKGVGTAGADAKESTGTRIKNAATSILGSNRKSDQAKAEPTEKTKAKSCKKGKQCGDTCIPKNAVCHL